MLRIKLEFRVTFWATISLIFMFFSISIETHALDYDDDTDLKFMWEAATGDVHHYNVYVNAYVSTDKDEYVLVGSTSDTAYIVKGEDGQTYRVKVQAVNAAGNVGPMSEASDPVTCDTRPSESIKDLSIAVSGNDILLEWTASASAVIYNVYRDTKPNFTADQTAGSNRIATDVTDENIATSGVQWTDTGVIIGETSANYFYVITTIDAAGNESGSSNMVGASKLKLVAWMSNLISLPLTLPESYTSYRFLEDIYGDTEILESLPQISRLNAATQTWETAYYDENDNLVRGVNFPIVGGEGYFVQVASDTFHTFTGDAITSPITLNLKRGENLIGIPYSAEEYTSYALLSSIPDCMRVMGYNVETLSWETARLDEEGRASGVDFNIQVGQGYYVYTMSDTSWTPGSNVAPMMIPQQTKLLQNYPNPFNPETWIPFQLSQASEVNLRIYNAAGHLVKTLSLGYKPAGMYLERSKSAYWDGRNDVGEPVASGVYFYELQTKTFKTMRKMMLLK